MLTFETIVAVMLGAVLLTALARMVGAPYPVFLALGGAALAFVPGAPAWTLDPQLALALFIAPVLLDAAYDSSLRDLKDNWAPVAGLVLGSVVLTTLAVAVVAHHLIPALPWGAAVALGAIVAPPDAAAATAVLRHARLPRRLQTILEGESLLNDASALLIYRLAVVTTVAGGFHAADVAPAFLFAVAGSLVVGWVLARIGLRLLGNIQHVPSSIIAQFGVTFLVWILAERIGLSGILTIVVYAITLARTAPLTTPARVRVPAFAVWDTAVFVLNVFAFVLIGMQLRPIWERLDPGMRHEYGIVAACVLGTVIVARFAWTMSYNTAIRWKLQRYGFHPPRPMMRPSFNGGLVISWCGMRGIVTLAAAFALPGEFPYRDLILLTAFCVVLGTLVLQGLTLKPLLRTMAFDDEDPIDEETERAEAAAFGAAIATLDGDTSSAAEALRTEYLERIEQGRSNRATPDHVPDERARLRRRAIDAARRTMLAMRDEGSIGEVPFQRLEQELDLAELGSGTPDGD